MQSAPLPRNEKARQLSVDELDVGHPGNEECFDRVTRLTATALRTPMCAFSVLTGDRQVFKSSVGMESSGTPRSVSFCGHTILGRDVFAVDDALSDPRFADSPLVNGAPGIRYYLGAPVRAPGGSNVGVICAMDREARQTTTQDRRMIADLARMLENELILRSMVIRDPLTGLYTRSSFGELAEHSWRRARGLGTRSAMVLFAVDRYLSHCNAWGREGTNEVLRLVGEEIDNSCAVPDLILGRLHDDRYALFIGNGDDTCVRTMAESIRFNVESKCRQRPERNGRTITLSAGYARDGEATGGDRSLTDLMERAHEALSRAKSAGGNRVVGLR